MGTIDFTEGRKNIQYQYCSLVSDLTNLFCNVNLHIINRTSRSMCPRSSQHYRIETRIL